MSLRRSWIRILLGGTFGLLAVLAAAIFLGWLSPERPWEQATGWTRVPAEDRPEMDRVVMPAIDAASSGDEPQITWLGHAGFVLRWNGRTILIDPNLSRRCSIARRVMERPIEPKELGPIDAVLISHAHYDHLDLDTLRALPAVDLLIVPSGAEGYLAGASLRDVHVTAVMPGDRRSIGNLEVIAVPAEHNGNRFHPFESEGHLAVGYIIRSAGRTLYFSGDTNATLDFESIGERWRPDVAILPIGAFRPRHPLAGYHLSPEEAAEAADRLGVDLVVPSHFGTFRLSLDAPDEALPRFARAARRRGLRWAMPVLASSERLERPVALLRPSEIGEAP